MKNDNSTKYPNLAKRVLGDGYLTSNDFRIGNVINSKLLGTNHLIQGFISRNEREYLYTDLQESYSELLDWQGVELTKELFEKIILNYTNGFKSKNHRWVAFHNMHLDIYFNEKENYYYYHTNQLQSMKIPFVHKFQNLIYELSGIELTIA